jgi:hypothetical protein
MIFLLSGLLLCSSLAEACYITAIAKINQTFPYENRIDGLTYSLSSSSGTSVCIEKQKISLLFLDKIEKLSIEHEKLSEICTSYKQNLKSSSVKHFEVLDKDSNVSVLDQFLEQCCNYFEKENFWPDNDWIFPVLFKVHSLKKFEQFEQKEKKIRTLLSNQSKELAEEQKKVFDLEQENKEQKWINSKNVAAADFQQIACISISFNAILLCITFFTCYKYYVIYIRS